MQLAHPNGFVCLVIKDINMRIKTKGSGLVEKSKHYPHAGIMHVDGIVRSRLAAFAEENL